MRWTGCPTERMFSSFRRWLLVRRYPVFHRTCRIDGGKKRRQLVHLLVTIGSDFARRDGALFDFDQFPRKHHDDQVDLRDAGSVFDTQRLDSASVGARGVGWSLAEALGSEEP